jgi:hypothetical protein
MVEIGVQEAQARAKARNRHEEHFKEAAQLLESWHREHADVQITKDFRLPAAQVHATLALAAATRAS